MLRATYFNGASIFFKICIVICFNVCNFRNYKQSSIISSNNLEPGYLWFMRGLRTYFIFISIKLNKKHEFPGTVSLFMYKIYKNHFHLKKIHQNWYLRMTVLRFLLKENITFHDSSMKRSLFKNRSFLL